MILLVFETRDANYHALPKNLQIHPQCLRDALPKKAKAMLECLIEELQLLRQEESDAPN